MLNVDLGPNVIALNSIGMPIDALPVRLAGDSEINSIGQPIDILDVMQASGGRKARFVSDRVVFNSAGNPVESIPVRGLAPTPDQWEWLNIDAFGKRLTTDNLIWGGFKLENNLVRGYWDGSRLRTVVRPGDVMPGDPSTTERAEVTSLGIVEYAVGANPALSSKVKITIPSGQANPSGGSNLTIYQFKITGGEATQLMLHANGNLRLRNWTGSAYTYQNLLTANYKGRELFVELDAVHSKTTAGQLRVKIDGTTLYSRLNQPNIPSSIADTEKVYLKAGVYRTSVDTDPTRGNASIWYRDTTFSPSFS